MRPPSAAVRAEAGRWGILRIMDVDAWLQAAVADAERRGLPELKPLLETLARSLAGLREAEASLPAPDTSDEGAPRA